tara:strand:+ start:205 stop:432 length:228 start_codon:yes stop_codon:yes gene_type:complete
MTKKTSLATHQNFISAINQLPSFVADTNADLDESYDWVADQIGLDSFVDDSEAWDLFYDAYHDAAQFVLPDVPLD